MLTLRSCRKVTVFVISTFNRLKLRILIKQKTLVKFIYFFDKKSKEYFYWFVIHVYDIR